MEGETVINYNIRCPWQLNWMKHGSILPEKETKIIHRCKITTE
jgi:hypothetical protein